MMTDALDRPGREPARRGSRPAPSATRPSRGGERSLAPREHGAYGQLALPLLVALLAGQPGPAAWLFALGAVALFVAHEPILVALGLRGAKARAGHGRRAVRFASVAGVITVTSVASGLALAPVAARWSALLCAVLATLVGVQILRRRERSLPGELLVGATLPALAVPVALSAGTSPAAAVGVWLVWTVGSAAATCAVRDAIASFKAGRSLGLRLLPIALCALAAGVASANAVLTIGHLIALAPMVGVSLALALRPPHPRHLRRVGWSLVVASVATAAALIYHSG